MSTATASTTSNNNPPQPQQAKQAAVGQARSHSPLVKQFLEYLKLEKHFSDRRGFVVLPWRDDPALEARIKENTGATLRCLPLDSSALGIAGGEPVAVFAKAY